jgi:SH3-like domain-containing protein
MGVCIWEKLSVRETPAESGKWITSVNLAEKVELLNESETEEVNGKKREFIKVKLMDGKEGWVMKDLIAMNAKAGALINDVELYARPDLLAKANKSFKRMDIIGVSEVQGEWCKIRGKRSGGTWIDEGWVKSAGISYDEKDIAVALYAKAALSPFRSSKADGRN